ncbi:hypothetical protein GZ989_011505 (plasmid) [Campylobacter fetus]|uniref:Uncharacterized protein n=1 Tax=Campylobacter fetus TaxID=196 RepID=A0A974MRQ6_CAMFE|nr:hypothetical protein [Campylobacter fetus]QMS59941.1 hypothetical protein GZ989_011505 [Campylobacter fetus]
MKFLAYKPIQDGYIVYFVGANQTKQNIEFNNLDKAVNNRIKNHKKADHDIIII